MSATAPDPDILLVVGNDERSSGTDGKVQLSGLTDLHRLLGDGPRLPVLQLTPGFRDRPRAIDLSPFRIVMNLVTEAELNPQVLSILEELLAGFGGRVVNHPQSVLASTRDQVARALAGIAELHVPQAVRLSAQGNPAALIAQGDLRFPALLRVAGAHTGAFVGRFDTAEALCSALAPAGDHLATEFVDFRSPDGLYRKYRIFWIGERIVLRHMLVAEDWNVHARSRMEFMAARPDLLNEEEALFAAGPDAFPPTVRSALKGVRERLTLDFFGMDFAILPDGRALLFEANATMNFFPFLPDPRFAYLLRAIDPAEQALRALLGLPSRPGGIVMAGSIGQMGR